MRGTRVLIVPVMCVLFMSSCSWMKRVRTSVLRHLPTHTKIQPAPEQQKAAMELLRQMNAETPGNVSSRKQRGEGQRLQPSAGQGERPPQGQGTGESPREEEQPGVTLPDVDLRESPGQTTYLPDTEVGEDGGDERDSTPRAVDPAMQHGLRSPSLPKLLPMDMDGKLNPGI